MESRKSCLDCVYLNGCSLVSHNLDEEGRVNINFLNTCAENCSHYYNPKGNNYG